MTYITTIYSGVYYILILDIVYMVLDIVVVIGKFFMLTEKLSYAIMLQVNNSQI